jgi:hypothetical protein
MSLGSLTLLRNLLLRSAVVCWALALMMSLLTVGLWDCWATTTAGLFHIAPQKLGSLMVNFFALVKFYAVFILLAPGLAIHWTIKRDYSGKQQN